MKTTIFQFGEGLTHCPHRCLGVRNEPEKGIVPRGLIYESRDGNGSGVVVVGLNPGVAKLNENKYMLENGINYQAVQDCWTKLGIHKFPYFEKPRRLMHDLGLSGDILWTNIAKCECLDSKVRISFSSAPQTFRFCAGLYLKKELEIGTISTWPIIACGKDAFTALSYIFTERKIIGIPHPTGAGIEYRKLLEDGKLKQSLKKRYDAFFSNHPFGAFWLSGRETEAN
jgi:hypothetical protein